METRDQVVQRAWREPFLRDKRHPLHTTRKKEDERQQLERDIIHELPETHRQKDFRRQKFVTQQVNKRPQYNR